MSTNINLLKIGGIEAVVHHKPVKNLHLNVLPPSGKVRVTVPEGMKEDAVITFLATRISWIKRMQIKFKEQERQTIREYVSGETHFLMGRKYRLEVIQESKNRIEIKGKKIILSVKPGTEKLKREELFNEWYRKYLREYLEKMIPEWEKKIGVKAEYWGIRRMKTKWGTCNHSRKNIWLNLELAKKPENCIEYVIVHELLHLIEEKHSKKYFELLEKYFPKWKSTREELNRFMLAHEEWEE